MTFAFAAVGVSAGVWREEVEWVGDGRGTAAAAAAAMDSLGGAMGAELVDDDDNTEEDAAVELAL